MRKHCAQLAQLVEQRTENPCVSGSIPELGILIYYGILAQVVEHLTFNQVVRGSNPRCLIKIRETSLGRVAFFLFSGTWRRYLTPNVRNNFTEKKIIHIIIFAKADCIECRAFTKRSSQ